MSNEKGTKSSIRGVLNGKEMFALADILKSRYVESRLDNTKFAKTLNDTPSERSSFRFDITPSHIASMLMTLDMEPNRPRFAKPIEPMQASVELILRVQELERLMELVKKELVIK